VIEVAEAMYQAGKVGAGPKMPEFLDEVNRGTQERYLTLARAAITVTGEPPTAAPGPQPSSELLDDLAEQLAWKLNHPQQFADGVRTTLARYASFRLDQVSDEVRKAMAI
jgi:hypothetical protein